MRSQAIPATLASLVSGYSWTRIEGGYSASEVFRLSAPGYPGLYLKVEPRDTDDELAEEKARLEWIGDRLPVPRVEAFAEDERHRYLLTTEVPGEDASDPRHRADLPRFVSLLAEGMRRIHSLPIAGCPFDHTLERQIEAARVRTVRGLVDEADFDDVRQDRRAAELFEDLLRTKPAGEDLVFTHGDYCLPNILIAAGRLSGFIDGGRAGIADRYQDLALAARSLAHNHGAEWVPLLFQEYGIAQPDEARLEFYKLLDEFF